MSDVLSTRASGLLAFLRGERYPYPHLWKTYPEYKPGDWIYLDDAPNFGPVTFKALLSAGLIEREPVMYYRRYRLRLPETEDVVADLGDLWAC